MSRARRVREKSKKMKDLLLGSGLLLMRSHKFRWQVINRKEFCSLSVAHPFPSSRWIKTHLKTGRHTHDSTTRKGDQMRSLDFHFKFIYDFKGRLNVESRAFFPLFLFRSVTLKYSCPKLGLKKKSHHHGNSGKLSVFDRLTKTGKLNHLTLEMLLVLGGVVFVCLKKLFLLVWKA